MCSEVRTCYDQLQIYTHPHTDKQTFISELSKSENCFLNCPGLPLSTRFASRDSRKAFSCLMVSSQNAGSISVMRSGVNGAFRLPPLDIHCRASLISVLNQAIELVDRFAQTSSCQVLDFSQNVNSRFCVIRKEANEGRS
uniref:Uncharacterized protein n=1 Tax=Rodentolepis nana TaxID=102285 RepID=A0A0R3TCE4_RODNA